MDQDVRKVGGTKTMGYWADGKKDYVNLESINP